MKIFLKVVLALAALSLSTLSSAFCLFKPAYSDYAACSPPTVMVFEFVNEITSRHILLSEISEINFVENGSAGPGWRRTTNAFALLPANYNQSYVAQLVDVCRFYSPVANSHLFTSSAAECAALKLPGSGWTFARVAFKSDPPVNGSCPALSPVPVYRYFNNRGGGDAERRYSADRSLKVQLEAQGWTDEGISFCALASYRIASASYVIAPFGTTDTQTCRNAPATPTTLSTTGYPSPISGGCMVFNDQPNATRIFSRNLQFGYFGSTDVSPFCARIGCLSGAAPAGDIFSAQSDFLTAATHSFAQMSAQTNVVPPLLGTAYGMYVNSIDAFTAPSPLASTSINPTLYFPSAPAQRVMPWKGSLQSDIEISSTDLRVKTLVRRAGGHAIAHPMLELIDTKSGHSVLITLATVSGEGQDDFSAFDPVLGKTIVSTVFRANPAFGERMWGDAYTCNADSASTGCGQNPNSYFSFRLRPADIAKVVAIARKIDTSLSTDIGDYALDNYAFNVRVFGDAEIGLTMNNFRLEIFTHE